ncbi:hypothetical protein [Pseudomonas fulva]|uniref:hypothetical protein n=1 Tax=Pseudomonas fulva TaxID=47880 RepID=UPI0032EE89C2
MSEYDPQANYNLIDFEGIKVGEVKKGKYYEGDSHEGDILGDVFHDRVEAVGKREGLTITRNDGTPFHLVLQEPEQA